MSRRNFGHTWWGRAWVEALEGRAQLDPNRLPRGRTYARKGMVGALEVTAGQLRASVRGSRPAPYRVTISIRRFSAPDWERLLDTVGAQLGYSAALLDGELPPELAEHARASGVDLLPGPGELRPRCSCPDSADPCKHSAAVCYLVADEVDDDPFVLFLLRGRGREEILGELRARRSRAVPARAVVEEGVSPEEAFARVPAPVPALPPLPDAPGRPVTPPLDPPPGGTLRADVLAELAADAGTVAWQLLSGNGDEVLGLSAEEDLARRAARLDDVTGLAAAAGLPARDLARWAIAWREAGRGGLGALRETWQPPRGRLAEGRAELDEADLPGDPGETKMWRNRLTRGDVQLRLGPDGRWYRFAHTRLGWLPDGPGSDHPVDALVVHE
ncbi:SWIM zinc finger family protein [Amycolatopsis taiwanensis]|uniref:SWIM-type domain-containing protein n=1 Tax=Amycolatopsis taiwanensis TaxID=342230 RepID=A0A9W6R9D6_9PSEU|nr:SWIM zinc finger family protein [Amycolatopsis taiwanensis]GLY69820.1 hypothetical protein Atai01_64390 [Amycolatopsis taiwanensis]